MQKYDIILIFIVRINVFTNTTPLRITWIHNIISLDMYPIKLKGGQIVMTARDISVVYCGRAHPHFTGLGGEAEPPGGDGSIGSPTAPAKDG